MEKIEKRSEYFYRDYFTESERITAGKSKEFLDEAAYFTLCWSAKEAIMKAFRKGLSLHPLKIEINNIEISGNIWNQLFIMGDHSPVEKVAWWTIDQGFVYVMIEMDQK
jgi:phosphopantetheine--protein transferase-like protein